MVLNIRLNSRGGVSVPSFLGVRPEHLARSPCTVVSDTQRAFPLAARSTFLAAQVEELEAPCCSRPASGPSSPSVLHGDEDCACPWPRPSGRDLVVAIALFRLAAIDHEIVEQVVMARSTSRPAGA